MNDWLALVVFVVISIAYLLDRLGADTGDEYSPESARVAYVDGAITLSELERRLDVALDEDAQRIRETVERVNGIGPDTSAALASRYATVDELEQADIEELEEVPGVGEHRAEAIVRRFE